MDAQKSCSWNATSRRLLMNPMDHGLFQSALLLVTKLEPCAFAEKEQPIRIALLRRAADLH